MRTQCERNANGMLTNNHEPITNNQSNNPLNPPSLGGETETLFAEFWKNYPRKSGKGFALEAWRALSPDRQTLQIMLAAIKNQMRQGGILNNIRDDRDFRPGAKRWLEERLWEDVGESQPEKKAEWYERAGFTGWDDAQTAGCHEDNWRYFEDGKRVKDDFGRPLKQEAVA